MEYFLARAMEVSRLTDGQLSVLHYEEEKRNRGMVPYEIQKLFKMQTLKEWFSLPDDDGAQARNVQALRIEMSKQDLIPHHGDLSVSDLYRLQEFDAQIVEVVKAGKLDFYYHGSRERRRLKESLEEKTAGGA